MEKKWNLYIIVKDVKTYIKRELSTSEAIKWLGENCKIENFGFFMCETEVFCECYYERKGNANAS